MKKETKKELLGLLLDSEPAQEEADEMDGGIRIVILQRGWIFVGKYFEHGEKCRLENANVIRNWGTTKGLGEIADNGPTSSTKLDPTPTVEFHKLTVIATIKCDTTVWKNKLS
jgi:hypothetical protein